MSSDSFAEKLHMRGLRGVSLSWRELRASVLVRNPNASPKRSPCSSRGTADRVERVILSGVSGHAAAGSLTVLMGPSGSGKTTLLNFLSGRTAAALSTSGAVRLNGRRASAAEFARVAGYVTQDDLLMTHLTPREHLMFTARMFLGGEGMTDALRGERVDAVLEFLGLGQCQHTPIGVPGVSRGISGGERKRVNIANTLMANPAAVFLDEPTSGLDSDSALHVVHMMHALAHRLGKTVICTLHSPSVEMLALSDTLLVLAEGRIAYAGAYADMVPHFEVLGIEFPTLRNPMDFVMSLLTRRAPPASRPVARRSAAVPTSSSTSSSSSCASSSAAPETPSQRLDRILAAAAASASTAAAAATADGDGDDHTAASDIGDGATTTATATEAGATATDAERGGEEREPRPGFCYRFARLFQRSLQTQLRSRILTQARAIQTLVLGVLVGAIYWQLERGATGGTDRLGMLFLTVINQFILSLIGVVSALPQERAVVLREIRDGAYSPGMYFIAKAQADTPMQSLFPAIFGTIVYWMVGFQADAGRFFMYIACVVLVSNIGASLGFVVAALTGDTTVALAIVPASVLPMMIFSGFLIKIGSIFVPLRYVSYINPFRYAFSLLAQNELRGLRFICKGAPCPIQSGDQLLRLNELEDTTIWQNFVILIAFLIFFRLLGLLSMRLAVKRQARKA